MHFKKTLLFVSVILMTVLAACKKDDKKTDDFPYSISNFGDVTLMAGTSTSVSYEVKLLHGDTQSINLSVSGLPAGVSVRFDHASATSGFKPTATYTVSEFLKPGSYPFSLIIHVPVQPDKILPANLVVTENCGIGVIGRYKVTEACGGSKDYTSDVYGLSDMHLKKFLINNLNNISVSAYVIFDCPTNTITIPVQNYNNGLETSTISGNGTIGNKSFTINYSIISPSSSNRCTATFTKM